MPSSSPRGPVRPASTSSSARCPRGSTSSIWGPAGCPRSTQRSRRWPRGCGPRSAGVAQRDPGEGQIRIKVKAAGISPTDLALRAGYLKDIPLPPNAVLGFEAAGTVDAVGPGVTGTSIGDGVTALLLGLGGYAEYA